MVQLPTWLAFLGNTVTWLIVAGVALIPSVFETIKRTIGLKGLQRQQVLIIGVIGLLLTSGLIASLGLASAGGSATGVKVSDIQVTTAFASDGGCTLAADGSDLRLYHVRCTDAQANETTGVYELDDGILTVTRQGVTTDGVSCPVSVSTASYMDEEDSSDINPYWILERDTAGRLAAFVQSGAAATTSSPRQSTSLVWTAGSATATLGVLMNFDEEGMDNLDQYSSKVVTVNICGQPYRFEIQSLY